MTEKLIKNDQGYSLAELSIVIAIVGLLVTGVTKGKSILDASKVRSQVAQLQNVKTAFESFKIKYNALPGDINYRNAGDFPELTNGEGPQGRGDGNKKIEGRAQGAGIWTQSGENTAIWMHLKQSGFYTDVPAGVIDYTVNGSLNVSQVYPEAKYDETYLLHLRPDSTSSRFSTNPAFRNSHYIHILGLTGNWNNNPTVALGLTTKQAFDIDTKMDDGIADSGNIQASDSTTYPSGLFAAITVCATSGVYNNIGDTSLDCNLMFKLD